MRVTLDVLDLVGHLWGKAKERGVYKGRQPTARAKTRQVLELKANGHRPVDIAKELKIGRASVYRILQAEGVA